MAASRALASGTTRREIFRAAGFERDGQRAADAAHAAVEREFADEEAVVDLFLVRPP
jgi:hypothetical protein